MQFRFCCNDWHWCDKKCETCYRVEKDEFKKQQERLKKERSMYKLWMTNNGMVDKIEQEQ